MPLAVTVHHVSGKTLEILMTHAAGATAAHLRAHICESAGAMADEVVLVPLAGQAAHCVPLDDSTMLMDLVGWFVLGGMLDHSCYKQITFKLELHAVILPKICFICRQPAHLRCERCRKVRYCKRACQRAHWPEHKAQCFRAKEQAQLLREGS